MKQLSSTIALVCITLTAPAAAPVVTNVVASQRSGTKLVDIRYDVFDPDGDTLKVRIEVSHNGGTNYSVPAVSLIGDLGGNVASGTNKLIVWNAGIDWDGEYSPLMRVKVIATDNRGFPGMEWGQEVPPGGFFLGQDSGPEGVGPGRHVNIPYSYWFSKYEITVGQYAEFLNTVLFAGEVSRSGSEIRTSGTSFVGVPFQTTIYYLGSDIQWNLNKLEVLPGRTNFPIVANWYGAIAFAQYYGYDLPTDAEWEKAARGADHDGLGEHRIYPWGNSINGGNANYGGSGDPFENGIGRTPVGYYNGGQVPFGPDMISGYGHYDIAGNAAEWTRTAPITSDAYPATESVNNGLHSLVSGSSRTVRGGSAGSGPDGLRCFVRDSSSQSGTYGFRVARRSP